MSEEVKKIKSQKLHSNYGVVLELQDNRVLENGVVKSPQEQNNR